MTDTTDSMHAVKGSLELHQQQSLGSQGKPLLTRVSMSSSSLHTMWETHFPTRFLFLSITFLIPTLSVSIILISLPFYPPPPNSRIVYFACEVKTFSNSHKNTSLQKPQCAPDLEDLILQTKCFFFLNK